MTDNQELQKKYEQLKRDFEFAGQIIHNMTVANQAAWIEWQEGRGAEAAMTWVHNGLFGPGLIPDDIDGRDANTYYQDNYSNVVGPRD